ncbi:MAG: tyrosine-type recombinase/integrase [Gammaproteobacteria bacterium]|nr:tyrosine-type recombinase/integrase [Gammaproteobacteria bacterium]
MREIEVICTQSQRQGLRGIRDRALVEVLYATGIRRVELTRLDLPDVDLEVGTVVVRRGKGGHDRRVPMHARACQWVRRGNGNERNCFCSGECAGRRFSATRWRIHPHASGSQRMNSTTRVRDAVRCHFEDGGPDSKILSIELSPAE